MKILLELEGIGTIHKIPDNYVVSDGIVKDKNGVESGLNPRFFGNITGALVELRDTFIEKKLLKSHKCTELSAFLRKIEKAQKEYRELLVEKGCGGTV